MTVSTFSTRESVVSHDGKLKICCFIHSLHGGGAERVMAGLASRLVGRGHDVTMLTLDDGSADRHAVDSRVVRRPLDVMSVSRTKFSALLNLRHRVRSIRAAMIAANPDVVLSFCDRTNILGVLASDGFVGGATDIPIVISERSDPSQQELGRAYRWLRGRTYPRADRVIAQTPSSAEYLETILRSAGRRRIAGPVDVIPSAVDPPLAMSDRARANQNRSIVSVGRLEHEKGFDRLIDAMATVTQRYPEWNLRIIGEGSQQAALQTQIELLQLGDRVSMPGWIQPVGDELAAAAIYVLPSRYEGFPSALMEAMAAGVPSVSVDCPSGPRAIIDHERNGLLVPSDAAGIAGGIERMIDNDEFRERIGLAGREVSDRFGWETMVDRYEQVLRAAATLKRTRRIAPPHDVL